MLLRNIILTIIICLITVGVSIAFSSPESPIEQRVLSQVRQAYQELCSDCRFEFRELRLPEINIKALDDLNVVIDGVTWAGSFLLPLEIAGQRVGWASGQIKILRQGLVARRALQTGDQITEADVEKEWVNVTFIKDQLATVQDISRLTPKRFLAVRQPLVMSELKKTTIVQRGQTVKVTYGDSDFEISTQMKAEESGGLGDLIRVKNTETQKILTVRVDKEGSARIE